MNRIISNLGMRRSSLLLFLFIMAPSFTVKPLIIQIASVIGFLLSWSLGDHLVKYGKYLLGIFSILSFGLIFYQYGTFQGLEAAVSLLTLIALVQSVRINSKKDFTLFVFICELLFLGQLLDEFSLWFGGYIFLISLFLFFLLARFYKVENSIEAQGNGERKKLIIKVFYYSVPLTIFLFFVFPRLPIGNLFSLKKKPAGVTGFTSSLRPGEIAKVVQDDSTYFRAKIPEDAIAFPNLYWRGGVLSKNSGFSWDKGDIRRAKDFTTKKEILFEYTINMSTLESSPLFHLKGTRRFKQTSPGHRISDPGGITYFHPYANHKGRYSAEYSGVESERIIPKDKYKYLELDPGVSERVISFAKTLGRGNPDETYQNILEFFRAQKFTYTLKPGVQNLESFIFSNKRGFCEHFSSAAAIFLRANQIPSRIVIGFHGGLYNPTGEYFQVRGQDAHAWLEYWNGKMWRRGDPTNVVAPERISFGSEGFLLRSQMPEGMQLKDFIGNRKNAFLTKAFFFFDSLYNQLNQRFLEYDSRAQRELFNLSNLRRYSRAILMSICILFLLGFFYFWRNSLKGEVDPVDKAYANFLKKLTKVGIVRGETEGALSLEKRLPLSWGSFRECSEILVLYREIKYAEKRHKIDLFLTKTRRFHPAKLAK